MGVGSLDKSSFFEWAAIVLVIFFSCCSRLGCVGRSVSIEKRWALALCKGDPGGLAQEESGKLALINAQLLRIDLICKLLAPLAGGCMITSLGYEIAAFSITVMTVIAWPVEMLCLKRVYLEPWCQQRLQEFDNATKQLQVTVAQTNEPMDPTSVGDPNSPAMLASQGKSLRFYFSQTTVWRSSLALAMLDLTVLSFGQIMNVYVLALGIDAALLAVYQSAGEVSSLLATMVTPRLMARFSSARAATFFTWAQLLCLVPSVIGASEWARAWPLMSSMLLNGGVMLSRFGYWGFVASVSQHMQENVSPTSALGTYAGVQKALESFFGSTAAVLGIVLCEPDQFQYLAFISFGSVLCAALIHTLSISHSDSDSPISSK